MQTWEVYYPEAAAAAVSAAGSEELAASAGDGLPISSVRLDVTAEPDCPGARQVEHNQHHPPPTHRPSLMRQTHSASSQQPARWSKKTDDLLRHVAPRCPPTLQSELGNWLEDSSRFRAFIASNQDKVRKKLSRPDAESRLDVRSELLIAYLLLADRRFELAFEAYGAQRLGPDLTVTYRANQRFNLEVTRLRATVESGTAGSGPPEPGVVKLANVITAKLRQLPGDVPNVLVITTRRLALDEARLAAAARLLKQHNDQNDHAFFARRGLQDARDFYARYVRLSDVVALDESSEPLRVSLSSNREARHPLPTAVLARLAACLTLAHRLPA